MIYLKLKSVICSVFVVFVANYPIHIGYSLCHIVPVPFM